jgi:hypothetical protein
VSCSEHWNSLAIVHYNHDELHDTDKIRLRYARLMKEWGKFDTL